MGLPVRTTNSGANCTHAIKAFIENITKRFNFCYIHRVLS